MFRWGVVVDSSPSPFLASCLFNFSPKNQIFSNTRVSCHQLEAWLRLFLQEPVTNISSHFILCFQLHIIHVWLSTAVFLKAAVGLKLQVQYPFFSVNLTSQCSIPKYEPFYDKAFITILKKRFLFQSWCWLICGACSPLLLRDNGQKMNAKIQFHPEPLLIYLSVLSDLHYYKPAACISYRPVRQSPVYVSHNNWRYTLYCMNRMTCKP